jgi:polyhydroxybutyrate depolymerase
MADHPRPPARTGPFTPIRALLLLLSVMLVAACGGGTRHAVVSGGVERVATLDRPERGAGPRPLLLVLHAAMLSGADLRSELRLTEAAREAGIVLAFPDAGGFVWNEGSFARVLPPAFAAADDVGFLDALIGDLVARGIADPDAIHLAGISNGGMMALRYACLRAERLASVAVLMATLPRAEEQPCRPARPLSLLMMAGTADPVTRWTGEVAFAGIATLQQRMSVPESFDAWRRANGCTGLQPPRALARRGHAGQPGVLVHAATGCAEGVSTLLYEVRGGGHRLPGGDAWPPLWLLGPATPDIEAEALLLDFALDPREAPGLGRVGYALRQDPGERKAGR